jgi:hypothetical protein
MESSSEVYVDHPVERSIVGLGDGLSTGEPAYEVYERVESAAPGDGIGYEGQRVIATRYDTREGKEILAWKVGVRDRSRDANNARARLEKGLCYEGSKPAVRACNKDNLLVNRHGAD